MISQIFDFQRLPLSRGKADERPCGPERLLYEEDLFSLMLFGLYDPLLLDSMRGLLLGDPPRAGLQGALLENGQLGWFLGGAGGIRSRSAMEVFLGLSARIKNSWSEARLHLCLTSSSWLDGLLQPTRLSRTHWALWINEENRAPNLHLNFSVLRQAPSDALITADNLCVSGSTDPPYA